MLSALAVTLAVVHALACAVVCLYALAQADLLVRSICAPGWSEVPAGEPLPTVVVQLPLRNEAAVVENLLRSVAKLDWPRDRLVLQILDDSDDETTALAAGMAEQLRETGTRVEHVRRPVRRGFKAGALADGMEAVEADVFAILDADFRPHPDFLRRTVPHLVADPQLAFVQGRWGHLNGGASLFTRSQAFHLDAHFTIEQRARSMGPLMMGFNGTAGVWRRAAIEAAGGWSADSLTEDLDLAFRAQLAGWRVLYLDDVEVPAELPADVRAIRTQQHRWMKGGAQVGRKLLRRVWASELALPGKLQATAHLLAGTVFLGVTALLVCTPLLGPLGTAVPALRSWTAPGLLGLQIALAVLVAFYATAMVRRAGAVGLLRFGRDFVPFLSLSTGLALHDARAVLEGWWGHESPFVRTPKVGEQRVVRYLPTGAGQIVLAELALAGWGAAGLVWALGQGDVVLSAFLASQSIGCAVVALGGRG